jgi:hypothetical protein
MTFWPAEKAMHSIAAGQNVAEKNTTKAVRPTGVFRSPSRLPAAKHIQSCYAQFFFFLYLYYHPLISIIFLFNSAIAL